MFLPRWVQIVGGIFLGLVALLCLWGSLALLSLPRKPSPVFFYGVVLILFTGSCWVLNKGARLVAGRPVEGGLIGHIGLHVSAWLFLLIPVAAMLAGTFWEAPVLLRSLQTVLYVSIFFVLRRMAISRSSGPDSG